MRNCFGTSLLLALAVRCWGVRMKPHIDAAVAGPQPTVVNASNHHEIVFPTSKKSNCFSFDAPRNAILRCGRLSEITCCRLFGRRGVAFTSARVTDSVCDRGGIIKAIKCANTITDCGTDSLVKRKTKFGVVYMSCREGKLFALAYSAMAYHTKLGAFSSDYLTSLYHDPYAGWGY